MAAAWESEGFDGFFARMPLTIGRPLHLLPHYIGLALSGGGFVGPYAILGIIAVAQLVFGAWAVWPLGSNRFLQGATALAIALHPWWPAGDILRFLPGQFSVLCVVIWFGAASRYLRTGRARWIMVSFTAPLIGLLTYQALALTLALSSLLLVMMIKTRMQRRVGLVAATFGAIGAVAAWSILLAPRISPTSYESQMGNHRIDIGTSLHAVVRTLLLHAAPLAVGVAFIGLIVIALGFNQRLPQRKSWLLLIAVAVTPLTAFSYAFEPLHLNDPERVALPIGVMLWVVLCCCLPALATDRTPRRLVAVLLVAASGAGATAGYMTWTSYSEAQIELLAAIEPIRDSLPADAQLVVSDLSGKYGDVYSFFPPYLNLALDVEYGPGADATLCTPAGVPRIHPTAALFPLPTTPDCSTLIADPGAIPLRILDTNSVHLKVYLLATPAGG